jgi:hypothetical protein
MTRAEAIEKLAEQDLSRLTPQERAEQIEVMLLEDWEGVPGWESIPRDLRREYTSGTLGAPPASARYDPLLRLWLRDRYLAATNAYLAGRLGLAPEGIVGSPESREPCPCCGRRTLATRGDYEICRVCWWEDDGQDNRDADRVSGGPNDRLSLTQARANVLMHGISDPAREHLRALQDPAEMYERGRSFVFSLDGATLREDKSEWASGAFRR